MAKRKKLNKRVVIFLVIFGFVFAAFGIAMIIANLPKDPLIYAKRAREAEKRGEYSDAERNYGIAITASDSKDPLYFYEMAQLQVEILKQPNITQSEMIARHRKTIGLLRAAMRRDPKYVDAQRMLEDIYWAQGMAYRQWQNYIVEADTLIKLVPDDHQTYMRRGVAKSQLAEAIPGAYTDPAIEDFRKAIELKKDKSDYWMQLIRFYRRIEKPDLAENIFKEAIETNPDDTSLLVQYAIFLHMGGKREKAVQQVQQAISGSPNKAIGYLAMASIHLIDKKLEKALEELQKAKDVEPTDQGVYRGLAKVYERQKEFDKAATAFREGLAVIQSQIKDKSSDELTETTRRGLERSRLNMHYELANMLLNTLKGEQKREVYEKVLDEVRTSLEQIAKAESKGPRRAKIAGRVAFIEGKIREAVDLLEEADKGFDGIDMETANLLIKLYLRVGMPGKAGNIIDRFVKIPKFADNPSVLCSKVMLQMQYRDYDQARELLNRVLARYPDFPTAKKLRVQLDLLTGVEEGVPEGVELTDRNIRLFIDRASRIWIADQREQAIALLEELHTRVPKVMGVTSKLFNMYVGQKQMEKAKALLKEARAIYPDHPLLRLQENLLNEPDLNKRVVMRLKEADKISDPLARALEKSSVYHQARMDKEYLQQLREAEKIDPDSEDVLGRLFRYAIEKKDWALGEDVVKRAAKINLDTVKGKLLEAQLAMAKEEHVEAIKMLKEILIDYPESKRIWVLLGNCYIRTQEYDKAYQAYSGVVSRDPSYVVGVIGLARVTHALGKMEEHWKWVEQAYRLLPTDPYIRQQHLVRQEEKLASPEEIIPKREQILRENPDDIQNRARLGNLYLRAKQYSKAEGTFLSIWKHPRVNKLQAARLLVNFYSDTGRYSDGVRICEEHLKTTEDKVGAYGLYGEFLTRYDVGQARRAFEKAIAADPKDERGYRRMAKFLADRRQWAQAAETMGKLLEISPQDLGHRKDLTRYLIEAGQYKRASEHLNKIIGADPSDVEALILNGILARKQRQWDRAERLFTRAHQMNPQSAEALIQRSRCYRDKGNLNRAKTDLEDAKKLSGDPAVATELANVLESLGDINGAIMVYADVLESYPNSSSLIQKLLQLFIRGQRWDQMHSLLIDAYERFPGDPTYRILEAEMLVRSKRQDMAIIALESALEMRPKHPQAVVMYLQLLIDAKQYEKASEFAQRYNNDSDLAPWTTAFRALALTKQNQHPEADKLFIAALKDVTSDRLGLVVQTITSAYKTDAALTKITTWAPIARPKDWQIFKLIGEINLDNGNPFRAKETLIKALELADSDRKKAQVNRVLGTAYYKLRDLGNAEKAYLATLEILPNDLHALNNLGYMYAEDLNQPTKAMPYVQRTVALIPTEPNALDSYGWTLAKVGKLRGAEEQLRRSVQNGPKMAINRYHLGWVYERRGRLNDAEEQYQTAYELIENDMDDPLYKLVRDALEAVQNTIKGKER